MPDLRRAKRVTVTMELLEQFLKQPVRVPNTLVTSNLPKDVQIIRVVPNDWGFSDPLQTRRDVHIMMASDEWDMVPEGAFIPEFSVEFTAHAYKPYVEEDEDDKT